MPDDHKEDKWPLSFVAYLHNASDRFNNIALELKAPGVFPATDKSPWSRPNPRTHYSGQHSYMGNASHDAETMI